jgi:hypothetical protein
MNYENLKFGSLNLINVSVEVQTGNGKAVSPTWTANVAAGPVWE